MKLSNQTALITGGCKGIGYATAIKFIKEGANVVIIDLDDKDVDDAVVGLQKYGNRIKGFAADVRIKLLSMLRFNLQRINSGHRYINQ
ncbi:SDR family NAD(P)-dependent oxidoreductase [Tuberibacillus sp. Marseille-P3662]|uniref:SDR family NAD(P)-dependent oxidoreductase n=1 Tax=Tuberibacillus sp. Marseille-P3662 TaxID=1965358 RepID=UPI0020CB1A27|nr:SDR family oxidoreductase [Tuberibacillus sp. Marseille-P3662]